ncbi:uncharacterized protein PODANS_6_10560 [Podospora anserina S mat+]|uniref:Podospora anserina S mat+ genomic DNA chromosome 6, supercontig 4 n=1 Tax=Podospora anserina (strain S / ATCC MYA-4624 / DSM 980 / FGSC 10383) TaxID=515849 RepID=B2ANI3_PODAN|nr:uncharacterized protein PODANS_6_10560 [Podospora anserina S mat+]CAP65564.1 unnamed protein product [Podospora anserina S mat+]CDP31559.1 Putative protein of unknown function [Podospora anserina S mat+]
MPTDLRDVTKPPGCSGGPPGPLPFAPDTKKITPVHEPYVPGVTFSNPFNEDPQTRARRDAQDFIEHQRKDWENATKRAKQEWDALFEKQRPEQPEQPEQRRTRPCDSGTNDRINFDRPSRRASSSKSNNHNILKRFSPAPSGKSKSSTTHTKSSRSQKFRDGTKKIAESVKSQSKSVLGKIKKFRSWFKKRLGNNKKKKKRKPSKKRKQKTA